MIRTSKSSPTSLWDKKDYKKRRYDDPGSTQLPSHIPLYLPLERSPTHLDDVRVQLSGPPSREAVPSTIDTEAPNQKVCNRYKDAPQPDHAQAAMTATSHLLSGPWDGAKAKRCMEALRDAGVPIDRVLYITVITRYLEAREIREAVHMLGAMHKDGFVPEAKLCGALVVACGNKAMDEREKVFAIMRELKLARNAWLCHRYRDGNDTSDYVIRKTETYLSSASWEEALACVEEMRLSRINPYSIYRAVALTYPKNNLAKEAREILGDFQDARIVVDADTLGSLVAAFKDGDLQGKAEKLLEEAVRQNILLPKLGFHSENHTLDLRRNVIEVAPPSSSWRKKVTIVSPELATALFKYREVREEKIESVYVGKRRNQKTKTAIAQCMRDAGVAPVTDVKRDGSRNTGRLISGWAVVRRWMRNGMTNIALKVFEEMMEQDLDICRGLIPQCHEHLPADQASEVCSVFISVCVKRGQIEDALGAFRQMAGKGYYPSALACNDLILACGTAKRRDDAEGVFRTALSSGHQADASLYRAMIKTCEQGEWPEATIQAFDVMMLQPGMKPDAGSYFAAIAACRQMENVERSAQLIEDAVQNGAFDPTLGYVPGTPGASGYTLRFSADAIAAKEMADPPSSLQRFLVQAVFEYHRSYERILAGTRFVIPSDDTTAEIEIRRMLRRTHSALTLTRKEGDLVLSKA